MVLIGLGHKARQGKSSVANFMEEYKPDPIGIIALADQLKHYCRVHHAQLLEEWQLANNTTEYPLCKEDPIYGYTKILQWYGTDVVRVYNPNAWIYALEDYVENMPVKPEILIVPDIRFPNEAQWIKDNGGYLVKVTRIDEDGYQFISKDRDANHPSEVALDDFEGWDFVIEVLENDFEDLKKKSIGVLNAIDHLQNLPAYYVDEPVDYNDVVLQSILDSDSTGFK